MRTDPRKIASLMTFEAITLAVASAVHLSGAFAGSKSSDGTAAGIAEAIIFFVLAFGAAALLRAPAWGETAALAATGFAIFGFVLGLTITIPGGDAADIAYHATMLPLLLLTAVLLVRSPRRRTLSA
jgi:hypothetical protein